MRMNKMIAEGDTITPHSIRSTYLTAGSEPIIKQFGS